MMNDSTTSNDGPRLFLHETAPVITSPHLSSPHSDRAGHAQEATLVDVLEYEQESNRSSKSSSKSYSHEGMLMTTPPADAGFFDRALPVHEKTLDPRLPVATIPPEHLHRTLVLCFDGTGDQFDADNSNIVQLFSMLKKDEKAKQMVYYQAGIGTYTSPKIATPLMAKVDKTLDAMIACHLDAHVMDGYEFLMQNYTAGDRICLFGFSRGAYTARSLAGMIHKVGLLPADNFQQVPFAYKMYTRADATGWEQSNGFKKAFSIDVQIEFVGVWDTVDSVGLLPKRLPFTTSNNIVRTFRHAVSLDERRAKFKANLWNRPTAQEAKLGINAASSSATGTIPAPAPILSPTAKDKNTPGGTTCSPRPKDQQRKSTNRQKELQDEKVLTALEKTYSVKHDRPTDVEEVWFSGCHCDIGGGSVANNTRHSLARIPLRWMIRECFRANTGIMFDSDRLREIGLDPSTLYPFITPRPPPLSATTSRIQSSPKEDKKGKGGMFLRKLDRHSDSEKTGSATATLPSTIGTEEEEELNDVLSPVYDQLELKWYWWILEIVPMKFRYQRGSAEGSKWVSYFGANMARPRKIPQQRKNGVRIHRSVNIRMNANHEEEMERKRNGKPYKPRPHIHDDITPTWVD